MPHVDPQKPSVGSTSPALSPRNNGASPPVNAAQALHDTVKIGARSAGAPALRPPTPFACLQCQLVGRRKLTCSKADVCAELPHSMAVGPILLACWLVTAVAFVLAVI